jgi:hypothetical protein
MEIINFFSNNKITRIQGAGGIVHFEESWANNLKSSKNSSTLKTKRLKKNKF